MTPSLPSRGLTVAVCRQSLRPRGDGRRFLRHNHQRRLSSAPEQPGLASTRDPAPTVRLGEARGGKNPARVCGEARWATGERRAWAWAESETGGGERRHTPSRGLGLKAGTLEGERTTVVRGAAPDGGRGPRCPTRARGLTAPRRRRCRRRRSTTCCSPAPLGPTRARVARDRRGSRSAAAAATGPAGDGVHGVSHRRRARTDAADGGSGERGAAGPLPCRSAVPGDCR